MSRLPARQSAARQSVAPPPPNHYSPRRSERSAARLAHQSGGLGVRSSNLRAPTKKILINQMLCARLAGGHNCRKGEIKGNKPLQYDGNHCRNRCSFSA
jgi:hypothetical protein